MKYKKKPVEIEAFVYKENKTAPDWFKDKIKDGTITTYVSGACTIKTLEGVMKSSPGDYIIKGIKGEIYACKPDIFEETYECVEDSKAETIRAINGKLKDIIMDRIKEYDSQSPSHSTKLYRRYESVRCLITLISGNKIKGTIKTEEEYDEALKILDNILPVPFKVEFEVNVTSEEDGEYIERAKEILREFQHMPFGETSVRAIREVIGMLAVRARVNGHNPKLFPIGINAGGTNYQINEDGYCEKFIDGSWVAAF